MTMTREQRGAYRHSLECTIKSAKTCAANFNTPVVVYRARNGFWMYGRLCVYEQRTGDNSHFYIEPSGEIIR